MAKKRMFSLSVVDTDDFLDMPVGAQLLYYHLGMHGDDDGFVANPRKIMRIARCKAKDLETLTDRGYIIPFESGVVAIRDWRINNELKNDRYHKTIYAEEKDMLELDDSGRYLYEPLPDTIWNRIGSSLEPEHNVT